MMLRDQFPALKYGAKLLASDVLGINTTGNVYYVIKSSNTAFLDKFIQDYDIAYADGSRAVYQDAGTGDGIQAALDACVAERNDYVLVLPDNDDYELTAALTLSKHSVHLIALAGLGMKFGANNSTRLHQNTASTQVLTITGRAVEVAGFFIKGANDTIVVSSSEHGLKFHENMVGMGTSAGGVAQGIYIGAGESTHNDIANNLITNYNPTGTKTCVAGITVVNGTRTVIRDNLIATGPDTTMTNGINIGGTPTFVLNNYLTEAVTGVFTTGITTAAGGFCTGNMLGMTTTTYIAGPEANVGVVNNYSSSGAGGALIVV